MSDDNSGSDEGEENSVEDDSLQCFEGHAGQSLVTAAVRGDLCTRTRRLSDSA